MNESLVADASSLIVMWCEQMADASSEVNLEQMAASNNGSGMHKFYCGVCQ